ncbi:MAG TPA: PLP-dependent aminotransferase family protein [Pyrinomonadaceae bacterium]|nr:PLP-dependent aminotransferase family protein [Pyrinomonadaceae bacterium]
MTTLLEEVRPEVVLANWTHAIKRSALQEMLQAASRPGVISFALGLPAPELFPVDEFEQAVSSVLGSDPRALQYQPPFTPLKSQIVELMRQRGVFCREEQVFLTAGAQQGMNLLVRLLLEPGGQLLMEDVIYPGFQQLVEPFAPDLLLVSTDAETGMDVDEVESLLKRGRRPSFIYAITDGHNPLSVSLSRRKRERLVELASHYGVPIIEDDAYGFLHYDGELDPPLRALDEDWVFYVGSFSKILAPALRVGWIIVPEKLMRPLSVIKEATDIDTATFSQRTISAYLAAGHLPDHLSRLHKEYRLRRETMHDALLEHFPAAAQWQRPKSGVFMWVELPGLDAGELVQHAIKKQQVAFVPGGAFSASGHWSQRQSLRLNFSHCGPAQIEEGISRLARAIADLSERAKFYDQLIPLN